MDDADRAALTGHRARIATWLDPAQEAFEACVADGLRQVPEGEALLSLEPSLLVSAAIASADDVRRPFHAAVLDALRNRRLPWTAADVTVLVTCVAAHVEERSGVFALSVATRFLDAHPGDPSVFCALQDLQHALEEESAHLYRAPELRHRVRALLAAQAPGHLLDLSVIDTEDAWGAHARDAFERAAVAEGRLTVLPPLLARCGRGRPSATWRRRVETLVAGSAAGRRLLRELLDPVPGLPFTSVDEDSAEFANGVTQWLVTPGNAVMLRGCALATAYVEADWVSPLLGHVALRGAAASPERWVTTALCAPAASAAIDTLGLRREAGDPDADEQLRLLYDEITRRDLLKRVADALGVDPEEAAAKSAAIAQVKRRAQARRHASPSRQHRQVLTRLVRAHVGPMLKGAGFRAKSSLVFARPAPGGIAVVRIGVNDALASVTLAVHHGDVPPLEPWAASVRGVLRGDAGAGGWLWDLGLDGEGDAREAAVLAAALVRRGLPWLALHDQPGESLRDVDSV